MRTSPTAGAGRRRSLVTLLLACLVGVLTLVVVPDGAADGAGRTVTLSASTDLRSGQEITVTWAGFTPDAPVYLHQCTNGTTQWRDCAELTRVEAVSDAAGGGSVTYPVFGGEVPRITGVVGANGPWNCAGGACMLVVSECGFDLPSELTVTKQLRFAGNDDGSNPEPSTTTTSSSTTTTLPEAGELREPAISAIADSDSQLVMRAWQFAVLEEPYRLDFDLTTVNAPTAVEGFTGNPVNGHEALYDLSFTNLPLDEAQVATMAEKGRGFTYVPVALDGLVIGQQFRINTIDVPDIRLSPETIAQIFLGNISSWNHPAITEDNRGCRLPNTNAGTSKTVAGIRTDRSGANYWFSSWMDATATESWAPILEPTGGVSANIGVEDSRLVGETGADRLARLVEEGRPDASGPEAARINSPTTGRFGAYGRGLAPELGTDLVRLPNGSGETVAPTDEAILEGFAQATRRDDGFWIPDFTTDAPGAYPLPLVTYAVVPTSLTDRFTPDKGVVVRELLTYLTSDEGQALAAEAGFVPLPAALRDQAAEAIATIPDEEPPPPTTTTTTTAPPTTPPLDVGPTDGGFGDGGFGDGGFGGDGFASGTGFDTSGSGGFSSAGGSGSVGAGTGTGGFDDGTGGLGEDVPLGDEVAVEALDDDGDDDGPRLVSLVVGAGGAVPTVTIVLLAGLCALAAGPALRTVRRRRR